MLDMKNYYSVKKVEDFTLFFEINNVHVIVKNRWNTWYFLSFNSF